ncbi:hypothetical protein [Ilumatobacter sp.]|uniref:hypothetical protein n=1 Tax=Ilumatobacter sp. TaxID=1967498 RepID=UPI003B52F211
MIGPRTQRAEPAPWTDGRPVRGRGSRPVLPRVSPPSTDEAPAAARYWIESARHRFSSVASFHRTGSSLVAIGAPSELVDRVLSAADDEHHHTEICPALARRSGAHDPRVVADVGDLTRHRRRVDGLVDTAIGALIDGVLGEGWAAARCESAARRSPELAAALGRLATDEARHAELAADIVGWCTSVRPWIDADLRFALGLVPAEAPRPPFVEELTDDVRARHGICTRPDRDETWAIALEGAQRLVAGVRVAAG